MTPPCERAISKKRFRHLPAERDVSDKLLRDRALKIQKNIFSLSPCG